MLSGRPSPSGCSRVTDMSPMPRRRDLLASTAACLTMAGLGGTADAVALGGHHETGVARSATAQRAARTQSTAPDKPAAGPAPAPGPRPGPAPPGGPAPGPPAGPAPSPPPGPAPPAGPRPGPAPAPGPAPGGPGTSSPGLTSSSTAPAAPVAGQTADAGTVSGTVSVTTPGSTTPQPLGPGASIPLGAVVDASHGVVQVTNALPGGRTQSATVWAGRFIMTQARSGHTTFHLVGAPQCSSGRLPHAARRPPVQLWAHDHHGRYSTRGQNSVATVRGTVWKTVESCAGTRTVVRQGVVSVLDLHTHRSVLVHAGHSVLIGPDGASRRS